MAYSSASICSIDGCKRAVTCLCRHCDQDVCSKHFNEHQIEVNNELIPVTDRLNELKMRLKIDSNQGSPLAKLDKWRDDKYKEIDQEYNRRVETLKEQIAKHDQEISRTILNIQELINEGDVSIDQVNEIQQTIDTLTNQVNNLLSNDGLDLVGTDVQMGGIQYRVKARMQCHDADLYVLESEKPLVGYNGLCPQCNTAHVILEPNRGMYALARTLHAKLENSK